MKEQERSTNATPLHISQAESAKLTRLGDAAFPADMSGMSFLHVGCGDGSLCFEALRRGASRVTGIDVHPEKLRQAREQNQHLGLGAEFTSADIESDSLEGRWNYVLCSGFLDKLRNPISVLDKLIAATEDHLTVELPTHGVKGAQVLKLKGGVLSSGNVARLLDRILLNRLPLLFVAEPQPKQILKSRKFLITNSGLENLLRQRKSIAKVSLQSSPSTGAARVTAHKRKIKKLLVIAGVAAAGKSTFTTKLLKGELSDVEDKIGLTGIAKLVDKERQLLKGLEKLPSGLAVIGDGRTAQDVGVKNYFLDEAMEPDLELTVLHFNLLQDYFDTIRPFDRNEALELTDCADEVIFLTIWAPPEVIKQRREMRDVAKAQRGVAKKPENVSRKRELYDDVRTVRQVYLDWIAFCQKKSKNHLIATFTDEVKLQTPEQWQDEIN